MTVIQSAKLDLNNDVGNTRHDHFHASLKVHSILQLVRPFVVLGASICSDFSLEHDADFFKHRLTVRLITVVRVEVLSGVVEPLAFHAHGVVGDAEAKLRIGIGFLDFPVSDDVVSFSVFIFRGLAFECELLALKEWQL